MNNSSPTRSRFATWMIKHWWAIICLFILSSVAAFLAEKHALNLWAIATPLVVWALCIPFLIILFVLLIKHKKWKRLATSLFLSLISGCIAAFSIVKLAWALFAIVVGNLLWPIVDSSDDFARYHPIPEGIEYSIPFDRDTPNEAVDSLVNINDTSSYLQIWNDWQGGEYKYDFYYPALPAGTLYLKCYEVGENYRLSRDGVHRASHSHGATTGFSKLVDKQEFTIYEGDWGQYYAVRVEVWHKDSLTHKKNKLLEKTYRMEGWMR